MKIEKIKNKYYITIDDESYEINQNTIIKYNLTYIEEIDKELKNRILDDIKFENNYQNALAFLKKRRTEYEVRQIIDKKYQDKVIDKLKEYHFIDDLAFGNDYLIEKKQIYKYGPLLIFKKLREKGLKDDIINMLDYGDELDNINYLIKKTSFKSSLALMKIKLYSNLTNKGYHSQIINEALEHLEFDDKSNLINDYNKAIKKYDDNKKVINYLYQKGYKYEDIKYIIRRDNNED